MNGCCRFGRGVKVAVYLSGQFTGHELRGKFVCGWELLKRGCNVRQKRLEQRALRAFAGLGREVIGWFFAVLKRQRAR